MKKKKASKKKTPSQKDTSNNIPQQNASPVCYADNKNLREGYREEK